MIRLAILLVLVGFLTAGEALSQDKIMQPGVPFHGIRDYRQVMPGVLYRGSLIPSFSLGHEGLGWP